MGSAYGNEALTRWLRDMMFSHLFYKIIGEICLMMLLSPVFLDFGRIRTFDIELKIRNHIL